MDNTVSEVNIVSVLVGKDSTATLLKAIEMDVPNIKAVYADTGHKHPETYKYLDYLEKTTGIEIKRLKPVFTAQIERKPSAKARFCTEALKKHPLQAYQENLLDEYDRIVVWVGVRRDESSALAKITNEWECEFGEKNGDPNIAQGIWIRRPILNWTAQDVFAMHHKHGIKSAIEWAKTSRGGRQYNSFDQLTDQPQCTSVYGLCE